MSPQELLLEAEQEFISKHNKTPKEYGYNEAVVIDKDFIIFAESKKEVKAFKIYRNILLSILRWLPVVILLLILACCFGVFYILPNYNNDKIFLIYLAGLCVVLFIILCTIHYLLKKSRKMQKIYENKIYPCLIR